MSELEFLQADPSNPAWRSPLRRALEHAPAGVKDITADAATAGTDALGPAAGVAGLELQHPKAEQILRRVTDLDLTQAPTVTAVAHVRALVQREAEDRYRVWFPQEFSDHVAHTLIDAIEGVA
jgi:sarcosine oxidase gamma subunit